MKIDIQTLSKDRVSDFLITEKAFVLICEALRRRAEFDPAASEQCTVLADFLEGREIAIDRPSKAALKAI